MSSIYDFIVVGAGAAGCVLASRLARTKAAPKVLLLEAGAKDETPDPDGIMIANRFVNFGKYDHLNYGYKTTPQKYLNNRQLDYNRGKGLGGSTAINICAWTVGSSADYDEWARIVGDDAFSWNQIHKKFQRMENYRFNPIDEKAREVHQPQTHGTSGPLQVENPPVLEPNIYQILIAAKEAGIATTLDINSGSNIGLGLDPNTARDGKRCTAAAMFLSDPPANLTIQTSAQVSRILLSENGTKTARGICTVDGKEYHATREVILSAGALDSPKILLLSGIGAPTDLEPHGITPFHNLPGVGKNLQDHTLLRTAYTHDATKNGTYATIPWHDSGATEAARQQFHRDGTGPFSVFSNSIAMGYFHDDQLHRQHAKADSFDPITSDLYAKYGKEASDYEWLFQTCSPLWFGADPSDKTSYIGVMSFGQHAQAKGTVTLKSSNPADPPLCDPNLVSNDWDKQVIITATQKLIAFTETPEFVARVGALKPFFAPKSTSDEDVWEFIKENIGTSWHMSCTAKMGDISKDEMACVDTSFRVHGLKGLRVVDMSVTPFLPAAHTVAIAYVIGETAAEKMIAEYGFDA